MNDVDGLLGSAMEIDGYYESLFDTDWSTSPGLLRAPITAPPVPTAAGSGVWSRCFSPGLRSPATATSPCWSAPRASGNPCTVAPSLCSPSGGTCPPAGFVNGYLVDLFFGSTPGTGVVLPADGTSASDTATTWFVHGGMDRLRRHLRPGRLRPAGRALDRRNPGRRDRQRRQPRRRLPARGAVARCRRGINSMAEANETWRGNILQLVSRQRDRAGGRGRRQRRRRHERAAPRGRSHHRRRDPRPGRFGRTEPRDRGSLPDGATQPGPAGPGRQPCWSSRDGLFNSTSGVWQGAVAPTTFVFTAEAAFSGAQLCVAVHRRPARRCSPRGATFSLLTFSVDSSQRARRRLPPGRPRRRLWGRRWIQPRAPVPGHLPAHDRLRTSTRACSWRPDTATSSRELRRSRSRLRATPRIPTSMGRAGSTRCTKTPRPGCSASRSARRARSTPWWTA